MEKVEVLKASPIFKGVSNAALSLLAAAAEEVDAPTGTTLFTGGEKPTKLFIVKSGTIDIVKRMDDRKGLVLSKEEFPQEIGLNSTMEESEHFLTAISSTDAKVVAIEINDLWSVLEQDPESEHSFLINVIREQSDSLRTINARFREFLARVLSW